MDQRRRLYLPIWLKLMIALGGATLWLLFSIWVAQAWATDISRELSVHPVIAWSMIALIALIPGFIVALMSAALLLDKQPELNLTTGTMPPITIIVAAYNEADRIQETLNFIDRSDYQGEIHVLVVDNNSSDNTADRARESGIDKKVTVLHEPRQGKHQALNTALEHVQTSLMCTIDADTILHPQALSRLVARYQRAPGDTVAIAGSILVRN